MRVTLAIILLVLNGCSHKLIPNQKSISKIDFNPYGVLSCRPGHSNSERAAAFEKIYMENHENPTFENQLLDYLHDHCMINYHNVSWFLHLRGGYTAIDDFPLAEKVLLTGLERIEELKDDEDYPYARCTLLWDITILYYWQHKLEEATNYACLTHNEEVFDCGLLLPAMEESEAVEFLDFYDQAIQVCE